MMCPNISHLNRLFSTGLVAAALVLPISLFTPLHAAPQARAQRAQGLMWHSYLPLDAGNRWLYTVQGPGSASRTWEARVTAEQSTGPFRTYFELSGYFPGKDSRLVRTTVFDTVQELGDNGKEYLWYEFGGRVGKSWVMELAPGEYPTCEDGANLTIGARDEVITVPAGEFRQVVRIDFMTKCVDAGITREWFAPGVGLIRREETSIAGPVISELVYAELAGKQVPFSRYATTLRLSSSRYIYNLMPPIDSSKLPRVHGAFILRDNTSLPAQLVFSTSCRGVQLEVRNQAGEVVFTINTLEGAACAAVIGHVDLGKGALVVPFSFPLTDKAGKPLPDGFYTITAILQTMPDTLRPAATALIEVKSVQ